MEIYLSHMVIFRIGEKLRLNTLLGNGVPQYIFTVAWALVGAAVFAMVMQKIIKKAEMMIENKKDKKYANLNGK